MKSIYKTLGLAIAMACFSLGAFAQKHLIYLKDHNVVRGKILQLEPRGSLSLRLNHANTMVIAMKNVDSIIDDYYQPSKYNPLNRKGRFYGEYFLGGGDGFGTGIFTEYLRAINPHFSVGAGLGFIAFNSFYDGDLALFADIHYRLLKSRVTPCASTKWGYSLAHDSFFFSPAVGVAFRKPNNRSLSLMLGINARIMTYGDYRYGYYYEGRALFGTYDLKIGYTF